jgi:hypothetical protein
MRTSEDVMELGLYTCGCCDQELIFDLGDTFCRCPRCESLCNWELGERITRIDDFEANVSAEKPLYSTSYVTVA